MFKFFKKNKIQVDIVYNKIVFLSRNKSLYTKLNLDDTFHNRINLIFLHTCLLFITLKNKSKNNSFKEWSQTMFDFIFKSIDINMRELGFSDTTINKNMKSLTKDFYNILLGLENYQNKTNVYKNSFFSKYIYFKKGIKNADITQLTLYFNNYYTFCCDLSLDSVLKEGLIFKYNNFI
tara:strand:- start:41 stop:574 length:534 start_codon:yes stop_codon:yes gene_type:complete